MEFQYIGVWCSFEKSLRWILTWFSCRAAPSSLERLSNLVFNCVFSFTSPSFCWAAILLLSFSSCKKWINSLLNLWLCRHEPRHYTLIMRGKFITRLLLDWSLFMRLLFLTIFNYDVTISKKFEKIMYLVFLPSILKFRGDAVKLSLQLVVLLLKIFLLLSWDAFVLLQCLKN